MIRERLRPGYEGDDREAAEWTLRTVTDQVLKVLAPFTPYLADYCWEGEASIHLENFPEVDDSKVDEELEKAMEVFQDIEEAVARLRQEKGIKLRHPVKKVTVSGDEATKEAVERLNNLLKERLNSRKVEYEQVELDYEVKLEYSKAGPELGDKVGKVEEKLKQEDAGEIASKIERGENVKVAGEKLGSDMFDVRTHVPEGKEGEEFSSGTVYIDTERTEELLDEAFVAETIRAVQQKRKEAGLNVDQEVELQFWGETKALEEFEDSIKSRINVSSLSYGEENLSYIGKAEFEGRKVQFGFENPAD